MQEVWKVASDLFGDVPLGCQMQAKPSLSVPIDEDTCRLLGSF